MVGHIAFLSERLTGDHFITAWHAQALLEADPAWSEWLATVGLHGRQDTFVYTAVDDNPKPRRRISGQNLSYKVGVDRLLAAEQDRDRLVAEWLLIFEEMCDYWAAKKETAPHPRLPEPDRPLPPRKREWLATLEAQYVVDAAESELIADAVLNADD